MDGSPENQVKMHSISNQDYITSAVICTHLFPKTIQLLKYVMKLTVFSSSFRHLYFSYHHHWGLCRL